MIEDLDLIQVSRFSGEVEILRKHKDLGSMARCLHLPGGQLGVARDFYAVHHLRESIPFNCKSLLSVLRFENALGVVCQEALADDCADLLKIEDAASARIRRNSSKSCIEKAVDLKALKKSQKISG